MLPEAKQKALLYATSIGYIYVFEYPVGKFLGKIYDEHYPVGVCSDADGNVFVTDYGYAQIVEYAHGGTDPIRTLSDPQLDPRSCSIDPTTGNLAVANNDPGGVAIFPDASGSPESYSPNLYYPNACAYDADGNLFVDGESSKSGGFALSELPRGGSTFSNIAVDQNIGGPGGLQWDGTYLALEDGDVPDAIYQVAVSGSTGRVVNTVTLGGPIDEPVGSQFWIGSGKVIMRYEIKKEEFSPRRIGVWKYPGGGAPLKTRKPFRADHLWDVTVSVAPK